MPAARADLGVLLRRTVLVGGALPAWDRRLTPRGRYLTVQLVAERLGRYRVRAARARRTDPVRLMTTLSVAGPDETLLVYPRFWHLDQFDVPVGRSYQPGGIPLASSTGDAIEFVGTRDYREGDPDQEHPLAVLGAPGEARGEGVPGGVLQPRGHHS